MSLTDDIDNAANESEKIAPPKGWEPYTETIGEQVGSAIVKIPSPGATEHDLLLSAGFDPESWQIDGPIQTRKWMAYHGDWLYYYKFSVKSGESKESKKIDVDELIKYLKKRKTKSPAKTTSGDGWALVISDLQIGKANGDIGTDDIIRFYTDCVDQAVKEVKHLRKFGKMMPEGALFGLGDIVENCFGFYPSQPFTVDLNQREQNRVARQLITYSINELMPLFDSFQVKAIGGNHGERRVDGKFVTDGGDNMDSECFDAVREAYNMAGIELDWDIPDQDLSLATTIGGVNVGITHGHLFKSGGATIQQKSINWFKNQIWGVQNVSECQILLHGHWHHLLVTQSGYRSLIQAPACDAGSLWYTQTSGEHTPPGVLTMRFDSNNPVGWDDLKVLSPR